MNSSSTATPGHVSETVCLHYKLHKREGERVSASVCIASLLTDVRWLVLLLRHVLSNSTHERAREFVDKKRRFVLIDCLH